MPAPFLLDDKNVEFPDANLAAIEPNGLLAVGGDLSIARLINAYQHGIFPWYAQGQPILWWSPNPRAVLFLDQLKLSRSLLKRLRNHEFKVTCDHAFVDVIKACQAPRKQSDETWITPAMQQAYIDLHQHGFAHSVEVWQQNKLVGGLYGVNIGAIFCGESMFSIATDASKIALVYLIHFLRQYGYLLIDCQLQNPHLESLGATEIERDKFLQILSHAKNQSGFSGNWHRELITDVAS